MERNRESRRTAAPVSANFSSSRRRSRSSVYRDPSGSCDVEDGGCDSHRDRSAGNKDRPSRRRRLSSSESFPIDRDDAEDQSSDESVDEDEDEDEDEPMRGGGSSSVRRTTGRGKPRWKGSDEVINVLVPRKARSASAKRLQDSISGARQSSCSPGRTGAPSVSPPSSNASVKATKRVKPVTTKPRPAMTSKVSISESEVEVAQFLFGLTRMQSHSSAVKPEVEQSYSQKDHFNHNLSNEVSVSAASNASSPVPTPISTRSSQLMALPPHSSSSHVPAATAPKRKKPRALLLEGTSGSAVGMTAGSSNPSGNAVAGISVGVDSTEPISKVEGEMEQKHAKVEPTSHKSDKHVEINIPVISKEETSASTSLLLQTSPLKVLQREEKPGLSSPVEAKLLGSTETLVHSAIFPDIEEKKEIDANGQFSLDQNHQPIQKELSSSIQDSPSISLADVKLEASKMSSAVSAEPEGVKTAKFEIDLMAPPENCYPDDCMPFEADTSYPLARQSQQSRQVIDGNDAKIKGNVKPSEFSERLIVGQDCCISDSKENFQTKEAAGTISMEKQSANDKKSQPSHEDNTVDKAGKKQLHSQKIPKNPTKQTEIGPSIGIITTTSMPIPLPIPSWPSSLPPYGCLGPSNLPGLPSLQAAKPVEGNSAISNAPFFLLPQPKPNRCSTHIFIAHLIHYQQQVARLNPFWHAAGSAAAVYGARPYNMNILPPSDALLLGNSVLRNGNFPANSNGGSNLLINLNNPNSKKAAANLHADAQRKQHMPPQGAAFIFPFTHPRTGDTKSNSAVDAGILPVPAAAAAISASPGAKFSNIAGASDPQHLTMLHGNYPFPIPPTYRAHMNPQLQPGAPFFGGSSYPSQVMQLPQARTSGTASGSLPSRKQLQSQQRLPTSKPFPESICTESESAGNSDNSTDNRHSLSQKKLLTPNLSGNPIVPANFLPNFPIMTPALGGKQPPPIDPNLQMSLKATEVSRSAPTGYSMSHTTPDVGHNHFHLGHKLVQAPNQLKAPTKSASKGNEKSLESISSQSVAVAAAAAGQQLPKQVMVQAKQSVCSLSTAVTAGGIASSDRPVAYSGAGSGLQAGSMGFPNNMQSHPHWKMPLTQRVVQLAPSGNASVQSAVSAAVTTSSSVGSPSNKATKMPSSPLNSTGRKNVVSQISQVQNPGKVQQLHGNSNSELVNQSSVSQKWHGEVSPAAQPAFPSSLNVRRPTNQQMQHSSAVLTVAGTNGYHSGGGKGPTVYNTLGGGNSVAVMTGASYVKSAANLPVKSAEQKPATEEYAQSRREI